MKTIREILEVSSMETEVWSARISEIPRGSAGGLCVRRDAISHAPSQSHALNQLPKG
jgi:hypothetical protein